MSQENYFGMALRETIKRNPEVFDLSGLDEKLKQGAKERTTLDGVNDAARAKRNGDDKPGNECAKLRRELFNLTERAKNVDIYLANQADNVKALEQRITDAIKQKKTAVANGNERAERNHEHAIKQLERELADAEKEFQRARKVSAGAAIALEEWSHHERLRELEKEISK